MRALFILQLSKGRGEEEVGLGVQKDKKDGQMHQTSNALVILKMLNKNWRVNRSVCNYWCSNTCRWIERDKTMQERCVNDIKQ